MKPVDNWNMLGASSGNDVLDMRDSFSLLEVIAEEAVELPIRVEEVIVGVDQENCCAGGVDGRHFD